MQQLKQHQQKLQQCKLCPNMIGPVITGNPVYSKILLVGQAPGDKEGKLGRPFAWTAGKTLFQWFAQIGIDETRFRNQVYMAAVCRCFPGKTPKGGDRVPNKQEIQNCRQWLDEEIQLLQPELIIAVGKLAIAQFIEVKKLTDVIGTIHPIHVNGNTIQLLPLPHPSGASTWHRSEPGKNLLQQALRLLQKQAVWQELI